MKKQEVKFKLNKITTNQFAVVEDVHIEKEKVSVQVGIDFGINYKDRLTACLANFRFLSDNKPFIIISVICDFIIENDAWLSFKDTEKNSIQIPKGFTQHLAAIAIGTTRGVLHAKTENTKYNDFFLPTVNVTKIIKDDAVFQIEDKVSK